MGVWGYILKKNSNIGTFASKVQQRAEEATSSYSATGDFF